MKAVGTATLATVVGGGGPRAGTAASLQTLALSPDTPAAPLGSQVSAASEAVYVFNVGSRDVALIDAATQQVRETRPLGAAVRWLSNEQRYWDGQNWTDHRAR